ncbi:hypothetical protein BDR03DRAFT_1012544 [Suillus americanus]|nr:hypothetical protein BDR03DRAFT_1012544 [Suillus americanus]
MLLTNQRLDKLAAAHTDFMACGMLGPHPNISQQDPSHDNGDVEDSGEANDSGEVDDDGKTDNGAKVDDGGEADESDKEDDGAVEGARVQSDVKLAHVPQCKRARTIHALAEELGVPNLPRLVHLFLYDKLLADDEHTSDTIPHSACPRFEGRIKVFGSAVSTFFALSNPSGIGGMRCECMTFPCALVHWFKLVSDEPDPGNGMWMVKPSVIYQ